MEISRRELEDYPDMLAEIEDLNRCIARGRQETVADVVTASSPSFPYNTHSITVRGTAPEDPALQKRRASLLKKLQERAEQVECFIETLPTSRQRRLVRMRILDSMTWHEVACHLGDRYTASGARTMYYRILKEHKVM